MPRKKRAVMFNNFEVSTDTVTLLLNGINTLTTSDVPEVVAALQKQAGEVSAMAERGMDAVHEMMQAH